MITIDQFIAMLPAGHSAANISSWYDKYQRSITEWTNLSPRQQGYFSPDKACEWLLALESGKYQQGVDRLRTNDKFCCLGVYCDLENEGNWYPSHESFEDEVTWCWKNHSKSEIEQITDLAAYQEYKLGLYGQQIDLLPTLNDNEVPFKSIAMILRAYYKDCGITLPCEK